MNKTLLNRNILSQMFSIGLVSLKKTTTKKKQGEKNNNNAKQSHQTNLPTKQANKTLLYQIL